MSEYLYCFKTEPKEISGLYVFQLTFRRGNAQDTADIDRICKRVEAQWEKKAEAFPTYYIQGKLEAGTLVYQITKDIVDPHWFDCGPMPGKPKVIGSLKREGRGWTIHPHFGVERKTTREDGCIHPDAPRLFMAGSGGVDYEFAYAEAGRLYKTHLPNETERERGIHFSFEVVPA